MLESLSQPLGYYSNIYIKNKVSVAYSSVELSSSLTPFILSSKETFPHTDCISASIPIITTDI